MITRRMMAAMFGALPFVARVPVAEAIPAKALKPLPVGSPVGDIAIRGKDVFQFDGKTWNLWCPCMDEGGTYCGWPQPERKSS